MLRAPSHVAHNGLMDELRAAALWGMIPDVTGQLPDSWFAIPRPTRALMVAYDRLERLASAIGQIDSQDYWDAYRERRSKLKGGRNGG